ncbi:MAG: histidine kinase dimerization/phospho-acceptor domain-containing protein [Candidatus Falkowbacteria bacterium]
MNLYERKIEINEWLITTRWFYMVAVFLIGILGNSLISLFSVRFSFLSVGILLVIFVFVNFYFDYILGQIKKNASEFKLKFLGLAQIAIELFLFTVIMHLGGDKDIGSIFYLLPIISASMIFGLRGSVITAILAAALVNLSMVFDYFGFLNDNVFSGQPFGLIETTELKYRTIALIKVITTSNFYLVLAIFLGYGSKLLALREQRLIAQTEKLGQEKNLKAREAAEMDKAAKLLSRQDAELKEINRKLKGKIEELEKSERSMIRAFADLSDARNKTEEERNKTAAIIANFVDPIIVIDKDNKINFLNPSAREIFGFIDSDLGREVLITNNYSMNNFRNIINRKFEVKSSKALRANNPNEEEVVINSGVQELTFKVITARVVDNKGQYLGVMKIFYNLTREKIIDKLKSEFISIAAHQLRTPLSAIKWVIKMVLDGDAGKLNEEQKKLLFKGYESNERIIGLVNDMLNVSRIEDGRFGYAFNYDDFNETLDTVIDGFSGIMERKKN